MSYVLLDPHGIVQGFHVNSRKFLEPRQGEGWTYANGWRIVQVPKEVPVQCGKRLYEGLTP